MDRVRLGRALGYGTRHAAKTFVAMAEAAAAPGPEPGQPAEGRASTHARPDTSRPPSRAAQAKNVASGVRGLRRSVLKPLTVYSVALSLRVSGVFFALLAATMGSAAWRLRPALHAGAAQPSHRFWIFSAFAVLFAYFAVSSFVRATLKERRAAAR